MVPPRSYVGARVAGQRSRPSGVHLDIEEGPSVEEGRLVIVLVPFYVMWDPCDRALLKHSSSSCYQVELWRSGLDDVIRVCALIQRGETIAPNMNGTGYNVVERTDLTNHGYDTKESGYFAAVRALIRWFCLGNIHTRAPIDTGFGFYHPGCGTMLVFKRPITQ
jgi:hypothetical protein